jgi:quercetin dioxygenase-like cupin family protein
VILRTAEELELSDAWVEGDDSARWRSGAALTPSTGSRDSGAVLLEIEPGCRLERHRDSAEETIVVLAGEAQVGVGDEGGRVPPGGLALIPADVPHEVSNRGPATLRFVALYASADVVTRYEREVQPDGTSQRDPLG